MSEEELTSYSKCLENWGFQKDPFGEAYPYEEGFWARSDDIKKYYKFLLRGGTEEDQVLNVLLIGDYGSGKTYTLRTLDHFVKTDLKQISIYFQIPTRYDVRGFRDILTQVISGVGSKNIIDTSKRLRTDAKTENREDFQDYLSKFIESHDLQNALANFAFDKEVALTWAWLLGKTTVWQERALDMLSSIKDETTGLVIISGLLDLLLTENNLVAFFIDELENLVGESRAVRSVREGLRNLYDLLIYRKRRGTVAIFSAVTGTAIFEIRSYLGEAFRDRVDEENELGPMSEEEAKTFVLRLFQWARPDHSSDITPPFKNVGSFDTFIKKLLARTPSLARSVGGPGSPRRLIKAGKNLLRRACFTNKSLLDSDFIDQVLLQYRGD